MTGHTLLPENRLEHADQIGGGPDLDPTGLAHQFHGAGVHQRDVGNVTIGGVLHGDPVNPGKQFSQGFVELLPRHIHPSLAGQRVELGGLDPVHKPDRITRGRYPVPPAATGMSGAVQTENPVGGHIAVVEIVEEPAVESRFTNGFLDGVQIHGLFPLLGYADSA